MLKRIASFLFGPEKKDSQSLLEAEVTFLREQNKSLLEIIQGFNSTKLKVSDPEDFRPKVFDHTTGAYRPKTDKEIEDDRKALSELGII